MEVMKNIFKPSAGSVCGKALRLHRDKWLTSALKDNYGIIAHLYGYKGERPVPTADDKKLVPWYNEFCGKTLCGMAQTYAAVGGEELRDAANELCKALRDAQCSDGYLGIYNEEERFGGDGENWDVWGHYHLISGLLLWYTVCGCSDSTVLDTALKAAECVWQHFSGSGKSFDSAGNQTMNLAVSHVFAKLYKMFGIQKYLDSAAEIVEKDWTLSGNWMAEALEGKEFYQSTLPRWEALHTIMTLGELYDITGEQKYYDAFDKIWHSILRTDVHNTGGFSSGEAAAGDPFADGAIETCCTVAWMSLSGEYLSRSFDVSAADALERAHYNAMLGSLMPDGRYITYNTPMWGEGRFRSQHVIGFQYNSASKEYNCCQANGSVGLSGLVKWALISADDRVYVNLYCDGEGVADGVNVTQHTDYPKNGNIKLTLTEASGRDRKIFLRIPSWADGARLSVNGSSTECAPASYAEFCLKGGETAEAELVLPMNIYTENGGGALRGALSLYRGPVLLTSETDESIAAKELPCTLEDIKNAAVGEDGVHYMTLSAGNVTLYDFATSGKERPYTSWHKLEK